MTKLELSIEKCKANIEKKQDAIYKHQAQIDKSWATLKNLGFKSDDVEGIHKELRYIEGKNSDKFNDGYDCIVTIESKMSDIKYAKRFIEHTQKRIEENLKKVEEEKAKASFIDSLPEKVKIFMNELEENWNRYDFTKRNACKSELTRISSLDYKEYAIERNILEKKYGGDLRELASRTDEQIKDKNKKLVEKLVLDFINNVKCKVGEITNFNNLSLNRDNQGYAILNGSVEGTQGTAKVESIYAGGYNIQRLHIRVLVK